MAKSRIPSWMLKLEIEGEDLAEEMLVGIRDRASDAKPVLKVIKELMRQRTEAQFVTDGERGGIPWEPDAPSTLAKKAAAGYPSHTEIMTGSLLESLQTRAPGGNAIRRLSKYSTTFGTKLFYAQFQGHKRVLLNITAGEADIYAERMVRWLVEGVGGASA